MDLKSDASDMEMVQKKEDEHLRLQRQVRQIQADRLQITAGVHPLFRRQDLLLKGLKEEYVDLTLDLKVQDQKEIARSGAHKKKDKKMKTDLNKALLSRGLCEAQCDDGVTAMHQLEQVTYRYTKQMLQLKKVVNASDGEMNQRQFQSEQRLVSTENRLETAMLRFNVLQYDNRTIREEIEHMLRDRYLFNQAWTKTLNALNKGKKFLTDLFESSTLAYDQRDEWCSKLRSLQDKGRLDQMVQVQEMRDLQRAFDNEMKLFNFLAKKGVMRRNEKEEERQEMVKMKEEEGAKEECRKYRNILEDISNYTKEDVEGTIASFEKLEQENFSIYKLMTDICAENETLSRDLKRIRQVLVDRKDYNESEDEKRDAKLHSLREELEKKVRVNEILMRKVGDKERLLTGVMERINDIFTMLDCSLEPFQNLLGDKGPSLRQLGLALSLIVDKIKTYLQIVYYYERHVRKKEAKSTSRLKKCTVRVSPPRASAALPINSLVPADPCPACVETRWMSRVCEAPEVPFTTQMAREALSGLDADPAFIRCDRIHALTDCRQQRSRLLLAARYMK